LELISGKQPELIRYNYFNYGCRYYVIHRGQMRWEQAVVLHWFIHREKCSTSIYKRNHMFSIPMHIPPGALTTTTLSTPSKTVLHSPDHGNLCTDQRQVLIMFTAVLAPKHLNFSHLDPEAFPFQGL
jgi:hypothetical protein